MERALYSHEPAIIAGAVKIIARPELQIFDYDLNGLGASKQFLQLFLGARATFGDLWRAIGNPKFSA